MNTATVLSINNVTVTGGQLNLTFKASVDYPSIAAIEVLCQGTCPASTPPLRTHRPGWPARAGETGIALDWADSPATDLMGYNVYRSTTETGTYTKLNSSPLAASTYVDTTAGSGAQVFYRVRAIDSSENESASSATVAVTPPLPPTIRINAGGPAQTVSGTTWSACSSLTACSNWVDRWQRLQRDRHHHRYSGRAEQHHLPVGVDRRRQRPLSVPGPSGSRCR